MSDISKHRLVEFMAARFLCTVATADENGRPEAAYVGYTSNDEQEIIIGTSNKSRKFKNLSRNKAIALVIADLEGEVQYEGTVEVITQDEYRSLFESGRFKKLGGFDKYRNDPTQVYLKITPSWIRYILHGDTDQIVEYTEFA